MNHENLMYLNNAIKNLRAQLRLAEQSLNHIEKLTGELHADRSKSLGDLPPMKMVEAILNKTKSGETYKFVSGLEAFYQERGYLTASQMDSLFSTYDSIILRES